MSEHNSSGVESDGKAAKGSRGGAIYNYYQLTVTDSTISGNHAQYAGGIANYGGPPPSQSPIRQFTVTPLGGGGLGNFNGGKLTITNCTITDNNATRFEAGGVDNDNGWVFIVDSTISGNSATTHGGGVYNNPYNGGTYSSLYGSIVASDTHGDLFGSFSGSYNLIGDNSSGLSGSSNIFNQSPILTPLGNYGGPTATLALLPGSPAFGAAQFFTITTAILLPPTNAASAESE